MRTKYNPMTKSYAAVGGKDEVMPQSNTKAPDCRLINGAPFGPYDDTQPVGPLKRGKGRTKE